MLIKFNKIKNKIYTLLRRSEKWAKTDMVYLAKGGFWLSFSTVVANVFGLAVTVAFANLLPPDLYGNYRYILSFFGLFLISTLPGINTATTRSVARGFEGSIIPGTIAKIKWGFIGAIASLSLAGYYFYNDNSTLGYGFLLASIFLPFFNACTNISGLFVGKKLFKESTLLGIPLKILYSAAMVITLFITNNIFFVLLVYLAINTINNFIFFIYGLVKYKKNNKIDPDNISYGKFLSFLNILSSILGNLDKIIIFHYFGAVKLAIYSFATILPDKMKIFTGIINKLALPKFSIDDENISKKALPKKVFRLMLFLIPVVILYILFAPLIFRLLFPAYQESIFYSQIFVLSVLVYPQGLLATYLRARMKKKQLFLVTSIIPIIRATLYIILIPLYGVMGAIISIIAARTFNFGLSYYLFKKL